MGKLDGTTTLMPVLIITLIVMVCIPVSSLGWVLELKPDVELEGPTIYLKDICLGEMPTAAMDIVLRDDVRPGETYNLGRRAILRRLVSMRRAEKISCRGVGNCRVTIGSRRLSQTDLDVAIFELLDPWRPDDYPGAPTGWLELDGELPPVFTSPSWTLDLVEPRLLRTGRNLIKLRVDCAGRTTRFSTTVIYHRYGETGRSLAAIRKSEPLRVDLFNWQWQDLVGLDPALLIGRQSLDHKLAASEIPPDTFLRKSHQKITPLVRQGEPVDLVVGRNGVEVTLRGVCREDGVRDQIVTVRNSLDGRLVSGRVIGPNRVAWRK